MKVHACSILYLQWFIAGHIAGHICPAKLLFPDDASHFHPASPLELLYSDPYNQK